MDVLPGDGYLAGAERLLARTPVPQTRLRRALGGIRRLRRGAGGLSADPRDASRQCAGRLRRRDRARGRPSDGA